MAHGLHAPLVPDQRWGQAKPPMKEHEMAHREQIISWLNDAYAMENGLIPILETYAKDFKDYPTAQARINEHVEATRRHADMDKKLIEHMGSTVSTATFGIGRFLGVTQNVLTALTGDDLVKVAIGCFGAENFERAAYDALIAAGQFIGDQEIVRVCESIRRDEEDMANWIAQQLPGLVQAELQKKQAQHKAA
jgi:ferritin-like metal-binding protein YciE